jgi:hypothetical protein
MAQNEGRAEAKNVVNVNVKKEISLREKLTGPDGKN